MAVSIRPKFNQAQIKAMLQQKVLRIERAILFKLQRSGEQFIANARNNGTYNDITGNLRSSLGYVVLHNGRQINSSFPGDKAPGRAQAKRIAEEAAAKYGRGFVLIVVAGMDYAAAVESKGKDVLTGSSLIAIDELKKSMAELRNKLENNA